jgi:hypothetical protein
MGKIAWDKGNPLCPLPSRSIALGYLNGFRQMFLPILLKFYAPFAWCTKLS